MIGNKSGKAFAARTVPSRRTSPWKGASSTHLLRSAGSRPSYLQHKGDASDLVQNVVPSSLLDLYSDRSRGRAPGAPREGGEDHAPGSTLCLIAFLDVIGLPATAYAKEGIRRVSSAQSWPIAF